MDPKITACISAASIVLTAVYFVGIVPWTKLIALCLCTGYIPWYFDGGPMRTDRSWPAFQKAGFWEAIGRYFPSRIVCPYKLDPKKQHIFACHPHGVGSINHGLTLTDACGFISEVFPVPRLDLSASVIFRIPLWREICLWLGCVDASRSMANKVLRAGFSTLILVGGEQEQVRARPGPGGHVAFLRSRKGFCRLALAHGCTLVPVYAWGENELYATSRALLGPRLAVVRALRVALPLFWGRAWCPILPKKHPLTLVFGKPIDVEKVSGEPSKAQIDALHTRYIQALQHLFEETKEEYGKQPTATLKII